MRTAFCIRPPLWLMLLVVLFSTSSHAAAPSAAPVFSDCQIGSADSPQHLQARCTTLTVPEDPARPVGKKIGLHVAVLKARASQPATDPLFYIAGGPGQASSEAFVMTSPAFDRVRSTRDIVLLDQRGTGRSNRLDCPVKPGEVLDTSDAGIAKGAADCLKQLAGDPRFYTTSVAVQDLDAVRAALGYASIDLYGISYGTRVALQYLRVFPDRARSVVLDGVVPADLALGPDISLDAERALKLIFTRCHADAACRQAFPDPAADFAALQAELKAHPAAVTLRDPLTGAPRNETLTWEKVAGAVRLMSYQSETASLLPLLIHQAAAARDYAPLMSTALIFTGEIESGFASGMADAVLCTEDAPFLTQDAAHQAAMQETYLGATTMDLLVKSCRLWPRGVMAADFKQPVSSDRPVLLLSGEDDPVTPPANARRAAKTLSDSLSLVVPGQGHGNIYRGCVPKLMAEFLDAGSPKDLDTSCIKDIKAFPFFINFSGPTP